MARPALFVGMSAAAWDIAREIELAAGCHAPLLLTGEPGVGKTLVARTVHERSRCSSRPLVTIDCGAARGPLEWELSQVPDDSTLLIREPGALDVACQTALLRFLETGDGSRASCLTTRRRAPRVICLTRRPLFDAVSRKRFLEDLYYRLNVLHVTIPPLRDRREDVPALLDCFLRTHDGMSGEARAQVSSDAVQRLMQYSWPGNVRQLEALVERLVATCAHRRIEVGLLPREIVDERHAVAHGDLFRRFLDGQESFWSGVYAPFMAHDLSRRTLRELVRLGLEHTAGDYRRLAGLFRVPERDYARFLGFLRDDQRHVPLACTRSTRAALRSRRRNGA